MKVRVIEVNKKENESLADAMNAKLEEIENGNEFNHVGMLLNGPNMGMIMVVKKEIIPPGFEGPVE